MKKKLLSLLICGLIVTPVYAVYSEKNTAQTISILRHELHLICLEKEKQNERNEKATQMEEVKYRKAVKKIKWLNELTLILYSQDRDNTLDQAFAIECVMEEYEKFNKSRTPKYSDIQSINEEINRYQRLIEALRLLKPKLDEIADVPDSIRVQYDFSNPEVVELGNFLDSLAMQYNTETEEATDSGLVRQREGNLLLQLEKFRLKVKNEGSDTTGLNTFILSSQTQADRDSCIVYARSIIKSYEKEKERIEGEELYFEQVHKRFLTNYEYALTRNQDIRKRIFLTGQDSYLEVLKNFKRYSADVFEDIMQKYGYGETEQDKNGLYESQWRGYVLVGALVYSLSYQLIIILIITLLTCVILRKVRPFNTEWFKHTRPVTIILAAAIIYFLIILIRSFFPMNNYLDISISLAIVYMWFLIALMLSILFGMKTADVRSGALAFLPVMVMGLLLMYCRGLFMTDKIITFILTPILLILFIWQILSITRFAKKCKGYMDVKRVLILTTVIFGLALIFAIEGYSLFTLMFLMWWIFQVAVFTTVSFIGHLMRYREKHGLSEMKERYASTHMMVSTSEKGDFIRITWFHDMIKMAVIPITLVLSIIGCMWLASDIFNLSDSFYDISNKTFFNFTNENGDQVLQISLFKLVFVIAWFFVFRYLNYLIRSIYRANKFEKMAEHSEDAMVRKNDVNLTLAYNVIGIIIWSIFVLLTIDILKIPLSAVSIVFAGLATGLGLALKDVLNNFIYGIQLMSGRLRVGDMVQCDGIEGTIEKISYQSTEIETLDGAVISFTNSAMFYKNFQNLTKNSPYVYVPVQIKIALGEDIEKIRNLILKELEGYKKKKDKYGRYLIQKDSGIWLTCKEFDTYTISLSINQMLLVESVYTYTAEVKEIVYKILNENGIVRSMSKPMTPKV